MLRLLTCPDSKVSIRNVEMSQQILIIFNNRESLNYVINKLNSRSRLVLTVAIPRPIKTTSSKILTNDNFVRTSNNVPIATHRDVIKKSLKKLQFHWSHHWIMPVTTHVIKNGLFVCHRLIVTLPFKHFKLTGGQLIEFHLTFSVDQKFLIIWAFDQILFWHLIESFNNESLIFYHLIEFFESFQLIEILK